MKRTLFVLSLFVITSTVNAQIKKGAMLIGGNLGFSTSKQTTDTSDLKSSSFSISPSFGKAIKENLILGVRLNYWKYKDDNSLPYSMDLYGGGIFLRQYKELGKGFYLYAQGDLGVAFGTSEYKKSIYNPNSYKVNRSGVSLSLTPGISYTLSRKLQLEAGLNNLVSINYNHEKTKPGPQPNAIVESKRDSFDMSTSLSGSNTLTLGLRVLIN